LAVIPAKAGIHKLFREITVDSRVRGNDKGLLMFLFQKCVTPDLYFHLYQLKDHRLYIFLIFIDSLFILC